MDIRVIEKDGRRYVECTADKVIINTEKDALDIIAVCFEKNISLLVIHSEILSEDFYNLRTGLAGAVLQKFANYHIKAALVMPSQEKIIGRFGEMVNEVNKGSDFRVFSSLSEAEKWIIK